MNRRSIKSRSKQSDVAKGFDFGTPYNVVVTGAPLWTRALHDAEVTGCAYGWHPVASLGTQVPAITLIAGQQEPIKAAFTEFHRWSEGSDNDAMDLIIIFLDSGGYLIGITPDPIAGLHEQWPIRSWLIR